MVVCLLRKNITQELACAIFGVSQTTVSRRWDLLRSLIGELLAPFVPHPNQVVGQGSAPVDRTICTTWSWKHIPDLILNQGRIARDEHPDRGHAGQVPGRRRPGVFMPTFKIMVRGVSGQREVPLTWEDTGC